ncbi:unnamed protein product [Blepharisma stoltei]|uniref:Receptor ligand binding region domain-containing protein n=1 Tax=Blepharisma stoltei TaxID=1481888 RepID=A0AAU9JGB7_9CILI|nr:unnamed protein product [Blepharisma stoltei]
MMHIPMKYYFLLFCEVAFGQFMTIPLLYSKYTPEIIKEVLLTEYNCPDLSSERCIGNADYFFVPLEVNDANDFLEFIVGQDILFLYDITYSSVISAYIDAFATQFLFMHLVSGYTPNAIPPLTYYDHTRYTLIRDGTIALVKHFGWQKIIVFVSKDFSEMDFQSVTEVEIVFITILPSGLSYETIYIIVSKEVKPLGVKTIIIATDDNMSKLIQRAIIEAEMNTKDYIYIFPHQSGWSAYLEGALTLEEYAWMPKNVANYAEIIINYSADFLMNLMKYYPIQGSFSLYTFYGFILTQVNLERFHIFNIQNSQPVLVGNITNRVVSFYTPPIFNGNTTTPPDNSKLKLPISISGGSINPDGSTYMYNAYCQLGSVHAIDSINSQSKILENFDLVINNITDCGASYFDSNYASSCFSRHSAELGYFHVAAQPIVMTEGTLTVFNSLNISVPVLGVESSSSLSNDFHSQYASVSFSNTYTANAIALLLASFRITKVSLLYLNNPWGENFKRQFLNRAESYKIEVMNKNQAVPSGFNGTDKSFVKEIVDLKTRYIVIEATNTEMFSIVVALYDLGMRKGDVYLISGGGLGLTSNVQYVIGEDSYNKLIELGDGSVYVTFLSYYNAFGEQIYGEFLKEYEVVYDYMCLYYDATYLGAYAIDSMISRGFNLNSSGIEEWIRKVQFTGCSGNVQISKSGNDRSTIKVGVYNLIRNNSNWQLTLSGINDPTKVVVYESLVDISWYTDNNGILPSDIIGADLSCPFKSEQEQSFLYGYLILLIIGGSFLIFDIYFLYKNLEFTLSRKYLMLQCKTEENILDNLMYFAMIVECFQYICIGPDFTDLFPGFFKKIIKISALDFRNFSKSFDWTIWYQIIMMEIILAVWLFFLIGKIFNVWRKCKIQLFVIISEIGNVLLPIIGDILFLPITWFLLLTFQCTKSIGDNFKDSFHNQDCSIFCWQDEHIKYIAGSSLAILLYLPASLYYRPSWKDNTGNLVFHFKEQPYNSAIKSFMQIVLVVMNTTLLPYSDIAYTVSFVSIVSIYGVFTLFKKPYNYDRASLWYTIFIFCCIWLWICCEVAKFNMVFAESIIGVGWVLLGIIGIIYQKRKLPSFLESPKGQDILRLFRFQLSKKSPFQAGIEASVSYIYIDQSSSDNKKSDLFSEGFNVEFLH